MIKKFLTYGGGNVFTASIPFLLLPFLTHYLTPDEIGVVAFIESLIILAAPLVIFGVDGTYAAFFHKVDSSERNLLSLTLVKIIGLSSVMGFLILVSLSYFRVVPVNIHWGWGCGLAILLSAQAINALRFSQLQMAGEALKYSLMKLSIGLLAAAVSVSAILFYSKTAESRILGILLGPILICLFSLFSIQKQGVFNSTGDKFGSIRKYVKFGFGLVFHSWSGILFFASDRIVIGYLESPTELGKYFVAMQIGMIMAVVQTTYSQVWTPYSFKIFKDNDLKNLKRNEIYSFLFLALLSIIIAALLPLIYSLMIDERYGNVIEISYWVVGSYFFLGLYKIYVVKLFYFEKTKLLAIITTSTAFLNIALTFLLVKSIGIKGAAIATFISSVIFFISIYLSSLSIMKNNMNNQKDIEICSD